MPIRYLLLPDATGPATHATSGTLTGPSSTVSGTSAHIAKHGTTGVLIGAGSSVVGSATNFTVHATTGALGGVASTVVGSAARAGGAITHATTGALTGQGSTVVGAASNFTIHAASGVLSGTNAIVVGSAARSGASVTHATSGVLTGAGSATIGTALGTSLSQRDIAYLLWYMEANLAIPTAAQISAAVWAEATRSLSTTGNTDIASAVLTAATTTPIHSEIKKVAGSTITGSGTSASPWGP